MTSIYDFSAQTLDGKLAQLSDWRGQVLLIGQVGREHIDFAAILSGQFRRQCLKPLLAARNKQKIVFGGKFSREYDAKSAGRSSDHSQSSEGA